MPSPSSGVRRAAPLVAVFALNMVMFAVADAVSTAGFIVYAGPAAMVWLWMGTLVVSFGTSGLVGTVIDRVPRSRLVGRLVAAGSVLYAALGVLFALHVALPVLYVALFILADEQFFVFPLAFWTFANDLHRGAEARRVFPVIQSGLALGQLVGNGIVVALANGLGGALAPAFMAVNAALGVVAVALLARHPELRSTAPTPRTRGKEDSTLLGAARVALDYLRNVPIMGAVALGALLVELALLLIQYRFLFALAGVGGVPQVETFFALYTAGMVAITAGIQWLLAGRLLERVGLKRAFGALPVVTVAAAAAAIGFPGLAGATSAQLTTQVAKWGWDSPAHSALEGLVPDQRRGRVATVLNSYVATCGSFLACIVLATTEPLARRHGHLAGWFAPVYLALAGLAGVGAWLCSRRVAALYDTSMWNWRLGSRRPSRALDALHLDI